MIKWLLIFMLVCSPCLAGVDLNGDADYLYHADGLDTDISGANQSMSACLWVKTTGTVLQVFLGKDNVSGSNRQYVFFYWQITDALAAFVSNDGSAGGFAQGANTSVNDGAWHHACFVYNDTDVRIYVDGALDSNGAENPKAYTNGIFDGNYQFQIGANYDGGIQNELDGEINDVAIWDSALTAAEIYILYNSEIKRLPLQIQPSNLKGYFPLDDHSGGTALGSLTFSDMSKGNTLNDIDADGDSFTTAETVLSYP